MEKTLVLHVAPLPKERPRAVMVGGHARIYTPRKTADYEKKIAAAWKTEHGAEPMEGPLAVRIVLGMPSPKSTTKAKRQDMLDRKIRPTVKPDLDNLDKAVMDALNKVAYKDDSQIVAKVSKKHYAEVPNVTIVISEYGKEEKQDG